MKLLLFINFHNASLCAHFLFNQWSEFDQTRREALLGQVGEVTRF